MELNKEYWANRYGEQDTPWDIGGPSPALIDFVEKQNDKELKILIPGAGKAHEAAFLFEKGYQNVFVCDWANAAFEALRVKSPNFPESQLLVSDFFELDGSYDLILEQTFFCALPKVRRLNYAEKVHQLLKDNGVLAGLLFASEFPFEGPPFGGTKEEYTSLFQPIFEIEEMGIAENSIGPRKGNELFVQFRRKKM